MSVDVEITFNSEKLITAAEWLEKNMPNDPLPAPQRWSLGYANDRSDRFGIQFTNEEDAIYFSLRWI